MSMKNLADGIRLKFTQKKIYVGMTTDQLRQKHGIIMGKQIVPVISRIRESRFAVRDRLHCRTIA
ncbi:hypothetical protein [Geobacter sp. SVR]|uniref:hypothetical protein n=1 Tax=Geobacter sp. SVR TaxID=2495594 RepID=UPI0015649781|nr:hypothetical protein [Geobacter sp. SVR]